MTQRIALYLRISLDRADQQIGVTRQRADCTTIAQTRWPDSPVIELVDNDASAYTTKPRPGYLQLLDLIRTRQVTAVVAYNLDRLLRQPRELETLIDLGVPIVTAQGDLDLTTHDGQLQARILVAVAKKSSDDSSRRIKRAHQDRAEKGLWHGGRYVPYGYALGSRPGELVVGEGASTVVAVAKSVVGGDTLASAIRQHVEGATGGDSRVRLVAGKLESSTGGVGGVAPRTREAWRVLLTGPTIRGYNSSWHAAAWPALIDEQLAASLALALEKKSRTRPNRRWPLSAVARCGKCGGKLYGTVNRGHHTYACRVVGCHGVCVDSAHLESDVRAALDEAVVTIRGDSRPARDDGALVRLEHITAEYLAGNIPVSIWEGAKRDYAAKQPPQVSVSLSARAGRELPLERCHEIIDHIVVRPIGKGGRYDNDRVTIVWRA